ncbi:ubiquinone biosynthesis accessory factor UbiJ [Alkalimarinus sediminis]|uniref:Ubiquinone biosynthesis accessory factor UbiJ n=1 Tax=Alkalimarinus sediminis TaxID=1632866 RepID=A0A9E8HJ61_9ALTE|nr:SCP2 sterol-binding domain-containing protein [Alkalimarinus sediminis]UZW74322.1 SCP2 sterol-binding domain-containing protein [Alkalimarinus sediminis]
MNVGGIKAESNKAKGAKIEDMKANSMDASGFKIDPSLMTVAVAAAETLVNNALSLDSSALAKIDQLDGAVFRVSLPPTNVSLTIHAHNGQLALSSNPEKFSEDEVNVSIEGSLLSLSRLMVESDKNNLIRSGEIKLQGDADVARQLQTLLSELNLDWESALANIMGDIPAHFLGQRIRQGASWSKQVHQSLTANIEEHLHEESRLLPNRIELQAQFSEIDNLRLATERLEARLAKLNAIALNKEQLCE